MQIQNGQILIEDADVAQLPLRLQAAFADAAGATNITAAQWATGILGDAAAKADAAYTTKRHTALLPLADELLNLPTAVQDGLIAQLAAAVTAAGQPSNP